MTLLVGMAWEARSGLKPIQQYCPKVKHRGRNGLGSPFGIETFGPVGHLDLRLYVGMAWEARSGLKRNVVYDKQR